MKWRKFGLVFVPSGDDDRMLSYATCPVAEHLYDDIFRIYFSSRDKLSRSSVFFLDIDIRSPLKPLDSPKGPVLGPGPLGAFDESGSISSWLLDHGGRKYLYYVGWNNAVTVPFRNAVGLAISRDGGLSFTRYSAGPLLDRSIHDPCFVASCCVIVEDATWRMWYLSCVRWDLEGSAARHYYHIKYAESHDGINWNRNGHVCIDFQSKDEYAISRPCVLREKDRYIMWYSYRGQSYRIGYAESRDGLDWRRKDSEAGIDVSRSGWDSEMIEYPFVFDHRGKRYMLYNGNDYGKSGFGLAVLDEGA
jgi:predicted GH43/DUF377 family glycosyl hydrolase